MALNPNRGLEATDDSSSLEDLYNINLVPSELFLKFRKEIQGFRVGLNLEFFNSHGNEYETKLVLKPLALDRRWKFIYEPIHGDIRLLSKKIPVTKYLNLQEWNSTLQQGMPVEKLHRNVPAATKHFWLPSEGPAARIERRHEEDNKLTTQAMAENPIPAKPKEKKGKFSPPSCPSLHTTLKP